MEELARRLEALAAKVDGKDAGGAARTLDEPEAVR